MFIGQSNRQIGALSRLDACESAASRFDGWDANASFRRHHRPPPAADPASADRGNLPPHSGEMAKLYGDINKPGPYLLLMKWNPDWFSAPHNYRTDRICVVLSGTWYVNSGADFTPQQTVPVQAGGFVLRHARTWHYDGVPANGKEPVAIAIFGTGPVDIRLAAPSKPSWRRV
jgi:hypothetical protein